MRGLEWNGVNIDILLVIGGEQVAYPHFIDVKMLFFII